jgi:hypothetical protein
MTRDKVIEAMRLAGLSDDQIEAALARLDLADKVTKFARALWQLGKGQAKVTFVVEGQAYKASIGDLTFEGQVTQIEVKPRPQGQGQGNKDSARRILEDLAARGGYQVTESALKSLKLKSSRAKVKGKVKRIRQGKSLRTLPRAADMW